MTARRPGPVEVACRRQLEAFGALHDTLGQAAMVLARQIDRGDFPDRTALFVRELRETLRELRPRDGGSDFASLVAELSASPVRNTQAP